MINNYRIYILCILCTRVRAISIDTYVRCCHLWFQELAGGQRPVVSPSDRGQDQDGLSRQPQQEGKTEEVASSIGVGKAMIRCNVDGLVVFAMRQDPCSRIRLSIPAGSKGIRSSSAASSLFNRAF